MLKRLLMGAGMAWLARKFMGGGRSRSGYSRGMGSGRGRGLFG